MFKRSFLQKMFFLLFVVFTASALLTSCGGGIGGGGIGGGGGDNDKLAIVSMDGKVGCINQKGQVVVPVIYDRIGIWSEGFASAGSGEKLGFINVKGDQIIPLTYDFDVDRGEMPFFREGLAAVSKNRKWGFVDITGAEVIPLNYHYVKPFSEGFAAVTGGGGWGFIDKTGKSAFWSKYERVSSFSEGLAAGRHKAYTKKLDSWNIIDTAGQELHTIHEYSRSYSFIGNFVDGLAPVLIGTNSFGYDDAFKFGFINTEGQEVIHATYDYFIDGDSEFCTHFSEGLVKVSRGKDYFSLKYGFVDKTGKVVVPLKYDWASDFNEGLATVSLNGKWGFVNQTGEEAISLMYDDVYQEGGIKSFAGFREGLAAVQKDDKWGFIDRTGKTVIPFKYDVANNFYEGLAYTSDGFIDKTGNVVISNNLLKDYTYVDNFVNVKTGK